MRVNRLVRIGLAILSVGVLLWLVSRMFGHSGPPDVATAPPATSTNSSDGGVTNVSTGNGRAIVARVDIPDHSILTADMLKEGPSSGSSSDAITNPDAAIGYITNTAILHDRPLRLGDLLGHITQVGIAGALRTGMRAMVVPISKPTLHDLVKIGNSVDIVAASGGEESRTIVQNVRVLAVDVFGKDYPPVKVAQRGDYKAPALGVSAANPPSAHAQAAPPAAPANPGAPAVPTPTPTNAPPAPAPAPALTLEVSPEQGTALSLAMASGALIDFLLRSPYEPGLTTALLPNGTPGPAALVPVVSMTRNRLFPYASRKNAGAPAVRTASAASATTTRSSRRGSGGGGADRPLPNWHDPIPQPPQDTHELPQGPQTYQIPIYMDGKLIRYDTVRRPQ